MVNIVSINVCKTHVVCAVAHSGSVLCFATRSCATGHGTAVSAALARVRCLQSDCCALQPLHSEGPNFKHFHANRQQQPAARTARARATTAAKKKEASNGSE